MLLQRGSFDPCLHLISRSRVILASAAFNVLVKAPHPRWTRGYQTRVRCWRSRASQCLEPFRPRRWRPWRRDVRDVGRACGDGRHKCKQPPSDSRSSSPPVVHGPRRPSTGRSIVTLWVPPCLSPVVAPACSVLQVSWHAADSSEASSLRTGVSATRPSRRRRTRAAAPADPRARAAPRPRTTRRRAMRPSYSRFRDTPRRA